jgi:hypothetical protein
LVLNESVTTLEIAAQTLLLGAADVLLPDTSQCHVLLLPSLPAVRRRVVDGLAFRRP